MSIIVNDDDEPIQNTVFVGDLHIHCTEAELQALFGPFGTITAVKIMRSQETGRNLSYGFVYYLHRDAAVAAINNLDGYLLRGRSLRVKWAAYKDKTSKNGPSKNQGNTSVEDTDKTPVHFSFISHQNEVVVTEEMLRYMFGKHGKVLDVSIRKLILDHKHQSGYGFVYYAATPEGTQSGLNAVKAYADYEANGIHYQCHISHRMDQQLQHLKVKSANDLLSMSSQGNTQELSNLSSSAPVHFNNVVDQLGSMVIKDNSAKTSTSRKPQEGQPNKFNQNQFARNFSPKNGINYSQQKQGFQPNLSGIQPAGFRPHADDSLNILGLQNGNYKSHGEEHLYRTYNQGPQPASYRGVEQGYGHQILTDSQTGSFRPQGDRRFANSFHPNNNINNKPQFPINFSEQSMLFGKDNSVYPGNTFNNSGLPVPNEALEQDFRPSYLGDPYSIGHRGAANDMVGNPSYAAHHQSIIHPRDSRLAMDSHHPLHRNELDHNLMVSHPSKNNFLQDSDDLGISFFSTSTKSQSMLGVQYTSQPPSVIYSQHNFSHSNVQILSPVTGTRTLNLQQPLFEKSSSLYIVQPVGASVLSSPVSPIQSPLITHHVPIFNGFHSVLPSPMGYHIFGNSSADVHYSPMQPQQSPLDFYGRGFVQADYASKAMHSAQQKTSHMPAVHPQSYAGHNPMGPGTSFQHNSSSRAVSSAAPKSVPETIPPAKEDLGVSPPITDEGILDGPAESHPADGEESNYDSGAGDLSTSVGGPFSNANESSNQKSVTKTRKVAANRLKNMTSNVSQPAPFVN